MKKILFVMSVAILIALCSAPSFIYADTVLDHVVGQAYVYNNRQYYVTDIYSLNEPVDSLSFDGDWIVSLDSQGKHALYIDKNNTHDGQIDLLTKSNLRVGYIPTISSAFSFTYHDSTRYIYNSANDYINGLPADLQPSLAKQRWDAFYEWYKLKHGFYPLPDSLIAMLRELTLNENEENTEIVFPTLTPTPSPSPSPTPIPVQTIFVPDGNGNTTIIYQYPDPTSGVITQSPYDPNINNNIQVDCNCGHGSDDDIFNTDPYDPTALTSSMLWANGSGDELIDNPLTVANDSQQSLSDAASEYSDSVGVVSNSFNVFPFKWLTLVGLLGGIIIIAGLIRTFLGG